jgi:hypothetical protein
VSEAIRALLASSLLVAGTGLAAWALDPLYRRWLDRREDTRAVIAQAEQLVRDDRDRTTLQSPAHRLEETPRP